MNLDTKKIDEILVDTKKICFPAYDEEAFLVWKRHD